MGTVSMSIDNRLPAWMVNMGAALIVLMAAGLIVCILRDIAEMRVLWAMEEAACRSGRRQRAAKKDVKHKKETAVSYSHHGVCLLETDLRSRSSRNGLPERKVE